MTERFSEEAQCDRLVDSGRPLHRGQGMSRIRAGVAGVLLGLALVVEPRLFSVELAPDAHDPVMRTTR